MIKIANKVDCCGCEACFNACPKNSIEMRFDDEGFLYPHVNQDTCIDCGLCEKVCPIINHVPRKENNKQQAYLLQHKDDEICMQSTAGGAFTGIASYVIEHGGIVFGVEMTKDFTVRHISVDDIEDLKKLRNSKYVQSRVGTSYKEVKKELQTGRMVCFSGTPCQIEGLRYYLGKDYDNLILVDVVCRAVPSPGVWKRYIENEAEKRGKISSIKFRDKTLGYQYSTIKIVNDKGVSRDGSESHPWLRMFLSGMIIRPSCTSCRFRGAYRNSDFTIWDCFPSYEYDKSFDVTRGTTRMLVHTHKGGKIITEIVQNYKIKEFEPNVILGDVKEVFSSPTFHKDRESFFKDYKVLPMDTLVKKYFPNTIRVRIIKISRRILNKLGIDVLVKQLIKRR